MRDKLLNGEIFDSMAEAKGLIEVWRAYYNTIKPHSSLEYMPPAPPENIVAAYLAVQEFGVYPIC